MTEDIGPVTFSVWGETIVVKDSEGKYELAIRGVDDKGRKLELLFNASNPDPVPVITRKGREKIAERNQDLFGEEMTPDNGERLKSIVDATMIYLNAKLGLEGRHKLRTSAATTSHIRARLQEGYLPDDFLSVIDYLVGLWGKDEKMRQYLTKTGTIFGPKFQGYVASAVTLKKVKTAADVFAELEKEQEKPADQGILGQRERELDQFAAVLEQVYEDRTKHTGAPVILFCRQVAMKDVSECVVEVRLRLEVKGEQKDSEVYKITLADQIDAPRIELELLNYGILGPTLIETCIPNLQISREYVEKAVANARSILLKEGR